VAPDTWEGGLLPDVRRPDLPTPVEYGKGTGALRLLMSGNTMGAHLASFDVGTYKKPHRHNAGAHIIVYEGTGYALMWDQWERRVRADFQNGAIYSPPEGWWHTHFNTGTDLVKHVALRLERRSGIGKLYRPRLGVQRGGDMLERADEPPELRAEFEAELARKGLRPAMPALT
jgi:hypothetical protein